MCVQALLLAVACTSAGPASSEAGSTGAGPETAAEPGPEDERLLVLPPLGPCNPQAAVPTRVRVATWNISAARVSSLAEVQEVLAALDADVVVLQELDVGVRRTGGVDQPRVLAQALGHAHAFAASVEFDGGDFGLAVLSRLPFAAVQRIGLDSQGGYEPRIALDVSVCAGARALRIIDVHADFFPEANTLNLIGLAAAVGSTLGTSTIIAGDLNATEQSPGVQALLEGTGTIDVLQAWDPGPTRGDVRIDYVLASPALASEVQQAARVQTDASDHLPLWVDLTLR